MELEDRLRGAASHAPLELRERTLAAVRDELRVVVESAWGRRERRAFASALTFFCASVLFCVFAYQSGQARIHAALGPPPTPLVIRDIARAVGEFDPAAQVDLEQQLVALVWRPTASARFGSTGVGG